MADKVHVECRFCHQVNRMNVQQALRKMPGAACGRCKKKLFITGDRPMRYIDLKSLEHRLDRETLENVRKMPGIDLLLKKLIQERYEKSARVFHFSNYVHVTSRQLSWLHRLFERAARRLDVAPLPDLFVINANSPISYALGADQPLVAVSVSLLELLDEAELLGVLSRELVQLTRGRSLYKMAARVVNEQGPTTAAFSLKLGAMALMPVRSALLAWDRLSELTADRGMLVANGSLERTIRTLLKICSANQKTYGQLELQEFLSQARRCMGMVKEHPLSRHVSLFASRTGRDAYGVWRAGHLLAFAEGKPFFDIMSGRYVQRPAARAKAEPPPPRAESAGPQEDDFIRKAKQELDDAAKRREADTGPS